MVEINRLDRLIATIKEVTTLSENKILSLDRVAYVCKQLQVSFYFDF